MISSYKSPLRFLAASLLVGGLSFASIAGAVKITIDPEGNVPDQPTVEKDFPGSTTIGSIKGWLETTDAGYPPELYALYFIDQEKKEIKLEDGKTIDSYGIKEGDTLILKESP
jgi:hypothetical protein